MAQYDCIEKYIRKGIEFAGGRLLFCVDGKSVIV